MIEVHIEGLKGYFSSSELFKCLQVSFNFHVNVHCCRCNPSFLRFNIRIELIIYIQASCFLLALFQGSNIEIRRKVLFQKEHWIISCVLQTEAQNIFYQPHHFLQAFIQLSSGAVLRRKIETYNAVGF